VYVHNAIAVDNFVAFVSSTQVQVNYSNCRFILLFVIFITARRISLWYSQCVWVTWQQKLTKD